MKPVLIAILLLLPTSVLSKDYNWNNHQLKGIPPHGEYTDWVATFSKDGKQRIGFVWYGNSVSFGTYDEKDLNNFDLTSRRDFGDYSTIAKFAKHSGRFAATRINGSDLSLVFKMTKKRILSSYLSDRSSCEEYISLLIIVNKTTVIEDICNIDHDLIRQAKTISVIINGNERKVSAVGSGASIIWLESF